MASVDDGGDRQDGGDWRQAALDWASQLAGASDAVRSSAQTGDADAARETAETVLVRLAEFMAALGLDIFDYILVSAADDGDEGPPDGPPTDGSASRRRWTWP